MLPFLGTGIVHQSPLGGDSADGFDDHGSGNGAGVEVTEAAFTQSRGAPQYRQHVPGGFGPRPGGCRYLPRRGAGQRRFGSRRPGIEHRFLPSLRLTALHDPIPHRSNQRQELGAGHG